MDYMNHQQILKKTPCHRGSSHWDLTYTAPSGAMVGKPEGKRPLGRSRHRWEDNIQMGLQEVECGELEWIELAQDRDRWRAPVNAVMNLRVL